MALKRDFEERRIVLEEINSLRHYGVKGMRWGVITQKLKQYAKNKAYNTGQRVKAYPGKKWKQHKEHREIEKVRKILESGNRRKINKLSEDRLLNATYRLESENRMREAVYGTHKKRKEKASAIDTATKYVNLVDKVGKISDRRRDRISKMF